MPLRLWLAGVLVSSVGAHVLSASGPARHVAAGAFASAGGQDGGGAGGEPRPPADGAPRPAQPGPAPLRKDNSPPIHHGEYNAYLRWLWWLVVLYFFWAQAEVCDEYFVPTIQVISDIFKIPDDVAGATIMALGCNGPELFINTVGVIRNSNLGIGAVVGGEVFNILVLCGAAVLATPGEYMPLKLSRFSFSRDVLFYAISVGLLYWAMGDNQVGLTESVVLLASGGVYSLVVAKSAALRRLFGRSAGAVQCAPPSPGASLRGSGLPSGREEEGQLSASPEEGCVLRVRAQYSSRLVDRSRLWERRFFRLAREGLLVSTDVRPAGAGRAARGIVFEHEDGAWHHGGLVNAPVPRPGEGAPRAAARRRASMPAGPGSAASGAAEEAAGPGDAPDWPPGGAGRRFSSASVLGLQERWEVVPLQDIVSCRAALSPQSPRFELQVLQHGIDLLAQVVRLELEASSLEAGKAWVAALAQGMQAARWGAAAAPSSNDTAYPVATGAQRRPSALRAWMDWLRFPVQFLLKVTVPDMKRPSARRWFPLAFLMSMAWLALFSFCVVHICDIIHDEFGISVTILGFTLAAVGTSFPNVISCIAVSRQGKTSMAIANALGANIQNVFLALALPWTIHVLVKGGPFGVSSSDLDTSVVAMIVTLVLLIVIVTFARCRMPRWAGALFLVIYALYFVITIGQYLVCSRWPLPC